MEPEKLNYNISDFAMATFEKKNGCSVRYLNGYQSIRKNIRNCYPYSYRLQRYEKKTNLTSNSLIISGILNS